MEEVQVQIQQAIRDLQREIRRLKRQGTRTGSIESYSRRGRYYYNYTVYEEGHPIRHYLPLRQKPKVEAEIQRGREVERWEAAISLLQEALQLLDLP